MIRAVADTHSLIWYLFDDASLSSTARKRMEEIADSGDHLAISSISLVEIVYLTEKDRISPAVLTRVMEALDSETSLLLETPLDRRVVSALREIDRALVPDLPDRVIAATARYLGVPLITKDSNIQRSSTETVW